MKVFSGISGAWNYTIGPAFLYEGARSIGDINLSSMPVVVVAPYVPLEELGKIDLNHVYGFVLEGGGYGDSARVFYSNQHRATVMRCEGILDAVKLGDTIVVDGVEGKVFLEPDEETIERYEELRLKGPPPEPEGFTDQLIKDAMEMQTLDPKTMREGLFDIASLGRILDIARKMHMAEALSPSEQKELLEVVKGTPVEANVTAKLQQFQDHVKQMTAEERYEYLLTTPFAEHAVRPGEKTQKPERGSSGRSRRRDG